MNTLRKSASPDTDNATPWWANRNVESAVFIETGDLRGDAPFVFHRADGTMVTVCSISELLGVIREADLLPNG